MSIGINCKKSFKTRLENDKDRRITRREMDDWWDERLALEWRIEQEL